MADRVVPPIPARCAHRPTTPDGLVIPVVNIRLADGGVDFRSQHDATVGRCWAGGLCQICAQPTTRPVLLLGGPAQLVSLLFGEPPLHPECCRYTVQACPMVAGRMTRFRPGAPLADRARGKTCADPGCSCGGYVPTPGANPAGPDDDPAGRPAHPWFALWVTGWAVAVDPDTHRIHGGVVRPDQVVRVRQVSAPGVEMPRWREVPDWLDRYQPPESVAEALDQAGLHRRPRP